MNRIDQKFKQLKAAKKKAFIAFITAGYPDLASTKKLVLEFDRIGVDIVELGVPFTDPMADGPMIQEASIAALKKGVSLRKILKLVEDLRKSTQIPLCLMTYYNPIFCFGEKRFIAQAKKSGVDGVIIPDLPPEEGKALISLANNSGITIICFLAPTSSPQRVKKVASIARGFIYYVSLTGVTGARAALPKDLLANIRKIKSQTKKPVCVGFGVSDKAQVRQIGNVADGVIVGSAIVKKIKEHSGSQDFARKVGKFVMALQGANRV
jgi:tryptophan synthase alpha chain